MPASCASASVGHTVRHQRRFSASWRTGWRPRAARRRRSGSMPASARVFSGAWIASDASAFFASSIASAA